MEAGTKALTTETGAGQWGSALAMARNFVDLALVPARRRSSWRSDVR
jgi:predicted alternative tryptophan synthase beta-subunit